MKSSSSFQYSVKRSPRSRLLRVSVFCDGTVSVTAPERASEGAVERFVRAKSRWIADKLDAFRPFRPIPRRMGRRDYLAHKERARALAAERLRHFNSFYGFSYGRIAIRDTKTRWGSCSAKGNLNFSYKIALLPPRLADYVIAHELCHIGAFDHSPRFWALVERSMPDWRERRAELREFSRMNLA